MINFYESAVTKAAFSEEDGGSRAEGRFQPSTAPRPTDSASCRAYGGPEHSKITL
jgi:hypothetical protein